jgi:hypothetical protein
MILYVPLMSEIRRKIPMDELSALAMTELTDSELGAVSGGDGFGLITAQANGASPPAANILQPPGNAQLGPGYGLETAVSTGNFPAFGPPHG